MRAWLKNLALYTVKWTGMFHASRFLTRRALRIICYHGISINDEHEFRKTLFMSEETFRERMAFLASSYTVLKLDEALERLRTDTLPPRSVVLTIDDGWIGSLRRATPVLNELGLPATLYLTTYYAEHSSPVFDVVVGYLLWKTIATSLKLDGLGELAGTVDLSVPGAREEVAERIIEHGNAAFDRVGRDRLLEELAERLGVDLVSIRRDRRFFLIPMAEVATLADVGVDVQLHTHRHRLDLESRQEVAREIHDNRTRLEPLVGHKLEHFCYPSGFHHPRVYTWLRDLGLKSATTTDTGFCYRNTPTFELPRIVDGENVAPIEFEAELSGALELLRRARAWFR